MHFLSTVHGQSLPHVVVGDDPMKFNDSMEFWLFDGVGDLAQTMASKSALRV